MKLRGIHLFIILILGLILCCFISSCTSCREGMKGNMRAKTMDIAKQVQQQGAKHAAEMNQEYNDMINSNYPPSNIGGDPSTWSPTSQPKSSYTGPAGDTVDVYSSDANIPWYDTGSSSSSSSSSSNSNIGGDPATWSPTNPPPPPQSGGIPASQIPAGDEDLYILKSQIVPPVCPACPSSASCPRQEPCQPCPPCARCPEPSFECKKVPNYSANNDQYLPRPVLNDFSSFGM